MARVSVTCAFCVSLSLQQTACLGLWTWQSMAGRSSNHAYSPPAPWVSKQELREQRVLGKLGSFLDGTRCRCADATCAATGAARAWCRGQHPECFDELLNRAPRGGYVMMRKNPLRFERVDDLLAADGSQQNFLQNQVPVKADWRVDMLLLTPIGPDAGRTPWTGPLKIEVPMSNNDLSINGTEYTCAARPDLEP